MDIAEDLGISERRGEGISWILNKTQIVACSPAVGPRKLIEEGGGKRGKGRELALPCMGVSDLYNSKAVDLSHEEGKPP